MLLDFYPPITKELVESKHALAPKRISFAYAHSGQPKRSSPPYIGAFSVPFFETIGQIFQSDTSYELFQSKQYAGYWRSIQSETEFEEIQGWVRGQGTRHFLRDCLDLSMALDQNLVDNESGMHTQLGLWESLAKGQHHETAISRLVDCFVSAIRELPYYRGADLIAAVPPRPGKTYDLPSTLASRISGALNVIDITPRFSFSGQKGTVKTLSFEAKWLAWEQAGLAFSPQLENRPSIILIDDKYQSGISLQYVASKLRAAGAGDIYGLCAVKTLRDDDNQ